MHKVSEPVYSLCTFISQQTIPVRLTGTGDGITFGLSQPVHSVGFLFGGGGGGASWPIYVK